MRITNVSGAPRHFSYIGQGGRLLQNGETSVEMPLATLLGENRVSEDLVDYATGTPGEDHKVRKGAYAFWWDIRNGIVTYTLSTADSAILTFVTSNAS